MIKRSEIWWANLPAPIASEPGYRRPILVVQSNNFNRSKIATAIGIVISSNIMLAKAPGNIFLPQKVSGLSKDSVVNVSQIITVDKTFLTECI
ncbi:MAG: type II toxin-antitoxin system PemK/MazF family toxin [Candidatus Hodarchaeota archaeon]